MIYSGTQEFFLLGQSASLGGETENEREEKMEWEPTLYYKLALWPLPAVQSNLECRAGPHGSLTPPICPGPSSLRLQWGQSFALPSLSSPAAV